MKDWKIRVFNLNTFLNSLNLCVIVIWLKYLDILTIPVLKIDFFPGDLLDKALIYMIEFASPFIILNYFLIFHKDKYKKIISQYEGEKMNIAFPYAIISVALFAITVIAYAVFWD